MAKTALTDEQEVTLIYQELEKLGYQQKPGAGSITVFANLGSTRFVVWPDAGWQQSRRNTVKASGNGIVNLRKHLRLDATGHRSNWSI